ncbi:MAG: class I SAM-dependent methyltransferase [Candidatus Moranbacteria bacterium]|nr:class I SAM-dependent methyltransferase [Candidatus Moranbacteria bacterium]
MHITNFFKKKGFNRLGKLSSNVAKLVESSTSALNQMVNQKKDKQSIEVEKKMVLNEEQIGDIIEVIKDWATTGDNSDKCLENNFLLVPVHFYQPIPDIKELEKRKAWDKVSALSGIKFDDNVFLNNLKELAKWADECRWSEDPTSDPREFYLNNRCFSYGCASALHSMIRENKPRRIIEIGSGNSSKIIREAVKLNEKDGFKCENYTIVDPYSLVDLDGYPNCTTVLKQPVELLNPEFFLGLKENDILFIDSSHVCKAGSDVNFEILEVLPILNKGVIIHFHDIDLPREYCKALFTTPTFRMFWTESYLLQAFLSCNKDFEIILPNAHISRNYSDLHKELFFHGKNVAFWGSNGFWIKKINKTTLL